MTMPAIDKGVPMPPARGGGRIAKYPFRQMGIGDSFVVTCPKGSTIERIHRGVSCCATMAAKRHGMKFATRRDGDSLRVWRIA